MQLIYYCRKIITILLLLSGAANATAIKPAFWQVEHQGVTSYLLGSIHVGKAKWYPLPNDIIKAFNQTNKLVVELDSESHQALMTQQMLLPTGTNLAQYMTPIAFQQLTSHIEKMAIDLQFINSLKPWAAASVLALLPYVKQGYMPRYGIDGHFIKQAKSRGVAIVELETAQFQIDLLAQLFSDEKIIVDLLAQTDESYRQLINAWKYGDLVTIENIIDEQMSPQQSQLMLIRRNHQWLGQLRTIFNGDKPHFIVVGSAHLVGAQGVVNLLKQAGFVITRIK